MYSKDRMIGPLTNTSHDYLAQVQASYLAQVRATNLALTAESHIPDRTLNPGIQ